MSARGSSFHKTGRYEACAGCRLPMPMQLNVDAAAGMTRTVVSGPFSVSDLRDHMRAVLECKAHRYPSLIDARDAELAKVRPRDLMEIAHVVRDGLGRRPMAPRAIVVRGEKHFGAARIFGSFVAGWMRVAVFDDLQAAEVWLDGVANPAGRGS